MAVNKDREKIRDLITNVLKKKKTPLMIIKKQSLIDQYNRFKACFPKVHPYFSVKANPHPEIIRIFAELGSGFDAASAEEINWVTANGGKSKDIIYANTIKPAAHIKRAKAKKISTMTFDNQLELKKIAENFPGADVVLRIRATNLGSVIELSLKFGAEANQTLPLLIKARKLGLNPVGVSFHVGSQCTNHETHAEALEISAEIFRECAAHRIKLSLLDIGGGFPIKHFERDAHPVIEDLAVLINTEISRLFPEDIKIIAEPGRFFVGPAGILVTRVIGKSFRNEMNYYYLDDGVYQDFSGVIFDHCKYEYKTLKKGRKYLSILAGPTCDSFDTIAVGVELPNLKIGDIVYVENIAAYSSATAVHGFNGYRPAEVILL
ncbi:MAG: type III PLP-dependent enzyme [Fibrobacterota bacterium]